MSAVVASMKNTTTNIKTTQIVSFDGFFLAWPSDKFFFLRSIFFFLDKTTDAAAWMEGKAV
jgi:hypothetical protein